MSDQVTVPPHGAKIGWFRNEWRQRDVTIYDHPTDPALVVTCGEPHAGLASDQPVWTVEPRERFAKYIGKFDQRFL
jgi:hypothetical protein